MGRGRNIGISDQDGRGSEGGKEGGEKGREVGWEVSRERGTDGGSLGWRERRRGG